MKEQCFNLSDKPMVTIKRNEQWEEFTVKPDEADIYSWKDAWKEVNEKR